MLYHENSKFNHYKMRRDGEQIAAFNNPYITARAAQPYKIYPANSSIDLGLYKGSPSTTLHDVLNIRRSLRLYDEKYKVSLNELAYILYNSYGVTKTSKITESFDVNGSWGLRNIPSAGGLYPLELYVAVLNGHINLSASLFRKIKQ